jgi:hypothetical protein
MKEPIRIYRTVIGNRKIKPDHILKGINLLWPWLLLVLFLLALHILAIIFEIYYINELGAYISIRLSGEIVMGRVESKRVIEISEGPDTYYVSYSFKHESEMFSKEYRVSGESYRSLVKGKELEIWYLPSNPNVSNIGGNLHPDFLFFTVILLIICFPYQGYSIYLAISRTKAVRRYLNANGDMGSAGTLSL